MSTADLALQEPESARPDLPIPLPPLTGLARAFRRGVIGLKEPSFARARQITVWWALAVLLVLIAGRTVITPRLTPFVLVVAAVLAIYTLIRVVAVAWFERQQHAFEPRWLGAQSEILRTHPFEIVRFTLLPAALDSAGGNPSPERRVFDLTKPGDVRELIRRQVAERAGKAGKAGKAPSRVDIEFTYWPGVGENPAIENVRRELTDIQFYPAPGAVPHPRVRFPEARYGSQPAMTQHEQGRPGRTTYWFLAGPVRLTAAVAASSMSGQGVSGPAGRPGPTGTVTERAT